MEPGDKLTITVSGKISSYGTEVTILRNTASYVADIFGSGIVPNDSRFSFTLDPNATFTVTHESQYRNGVHIDSKGKYWMRRPEGWYPMRVAGDPSGHPGKPTLPVERLVEAKDKRA